MSAEAIATVVLAVVGILGCISAVVAWFYKRGGEERELTVAVKNNTAATDKLSEHMDKIGGTLVVHGEKLVEHDARLKAGGL